MLLPDYHATTGLVGSKDEYFCYLYMRWGVGGIYGNIGNIIASKRLDTFIYISGTLGIAMETDIAEVGLHKTWLQVGDTDSRIGNIDAQAIGECLDCSLCSTIDITSSIGGITSYRAYIDNMSVIALYHARHHKARHRLETLDIGINHCFPIIKIAFILWFKAKSQSCIVYQHINILPFCRQRFDKL